MCQSYLCGCSLGWHEAAALASAARERGFDSRGRKHAWRVAASLLCVSKAVSQCKKSKKK